MTHQENEETQSGGKRRERRTLYAHLEQIDTDLSREGVRINLRAYEAVNRLAHHLGVGSPLGDLRASAIQHDTSHYLVRVTATWYNEKYGTHNRFDASPGSTVIWLAGRPWRIKFPRLYGKFRFMCWPLDGYAAEEDQAASIDVLEYIEDFPPGLRITLATDQRMEMRSLFAFASDTLHMLQDREESTKVKEVRANLQTAVARIMDAPRHYGESKWSSLEASEKALKGYLDLREVSYERRHGLVDLWHQAREAGLRSGVSEEDLGHIDCSANVKYGESAVSALEAVQAHQMSISVVRSCVIALPMDGWVQQMVKPSRSKPAEEKEG